MSKIPTPGLASFSLSEDEIEKALDYPIEDTVRIESKILPDVDKPNAIKRVVASGLIVWKSNGDKSLSRLVLHLLYLYFTGQLQVVNNIVVSRMSMDDYIEDDIDDDDFDDDFGFFEG